MSKISAVIPAYNAEKHVSEAIEKQEKLLNEDNIFNFFYALFTNNKNFLNTGSCNYLYTI